MTFLSQSLKGEILYTLPNGDTAVNVLWFTRQDLADPSAGDVGTLAGLLASWVGSDNFQGETDLALYKHMNLATTISLVRVTSVGTTPPIQVASTINLAGVNTGLPLPNESAVVTTWYSAGVGRSYRGRSFFPGADPDMLDATGRLSSSQLTSWGATMAALADGLSSEGTFYQVVHSPTLSQNNQVLSSIVRAVIHHQSRRNA